MRRFTVLIGLGLALSLPGRADATAPKRSGLKVGSAFVPVTYVKSGRANNRTRVKVGVLHATPLFRMAGAQIDGRAKLPAVQALSCSHNRATPVSLLDAEIEQMTLASLDANSKDPAKLSFTLRSSARKTGPTESCPAPIAKAGAQTLVPQNSFTVEFNIDGIPQGLNVHSVSAIQISFPETPVSSTRSRTGETSKPAEFSPVTFHAHGDRQQVQAVVEAFQRVGNGKPLRGNALVNVVRSAANTKSIVQIRLSELELQSFNPFNSVNADDPNTLNFSFTVRPKSVKIST